ncbi:hypothetical protein INR49_016184 [Caranx melampygus]|nr:hypothetical protein INR49_016184 [Caranx melampygus]
MRASELLLETLEELVKSDFDKFKWYLSMDILEGCKPIPRSYLEEASRINTVSKMAEYYVEELAVSISIEILKKMNMNNTAVKLTNKYAGENSFYLHPSSATAPPTAPASISAVDGGVVIAPTVSGCTAGSWNITINKT